jgi:hypothetical protein
MSDTPETDKALNAFPQHHSGQRLMVLAAKLERERDEAREVAEKINANVITGTHYLKFPWEGADNE